jgi:hypothetical protein
MSQCSSTPDIPAPERHFGSDFAPLLWPRVPAVTTGRRLAEQALRQPMADLGWAPRAAGWFTAEIADGSLGVISVGIASKHSQPGMALATLYVGLRAEEIEPLVAQLSGAPDDGYRTRTAVTSLGYLEPDHRWHEWAISEGTADSSAAAMAAAVRAHATSWLRRLADDPDALVDAARASAESGQATGICRVAVLLGTSGRVDEARAFLGEHVTALQPRTDVAAESQRASIARASGWLDECSSGDAPVAP